MDMKIAIICGGPSEERGVSLNSARSFLDHTSSLRIEIIPFYMNIKGDFYQLTKGQLYSNTPSDFDFKLKEISFLLSEKAFIERLEEVDLVFPIIHGTYGEDGKIQDLLEKNQIPFIGSSSAVCRSVFDKYEARKILEKKGYPVFPSRFIGERDGEIDFFCRPAIIKPTKSGSSIGVTYVESKKEAIDAIKDLRDKGFHELLLEPYCQDREFTICVMENTAHVPVSLIPLEIELLSKKDRILDYRKKYLPSDQIRYHCPPRFSKEEVQSIRKTAKALFQDLGFRDFARIDGWITQEGRIYFSDFNPISGMEQNSFLFQQLAQVGISHADFFEYLLKSQSKKEKEESCKKELVYVLMGGATAERQVSLMSGTNVWLKLLQHPKYAPVPFLLDRKGDVWELPYAYMLHHTVDEVEERCKKSEERDLSLINEIREDLGLELLSDFKKPKLLSLSAFIQKAKKNSAFVFIALHGGIGEDGTIQKKLEEEGLFFNGSNSTVSSVCMDKYETACLIASMEDPTILPMPQIVIDLNSLEDEKAFWEKAVSYFKTEDLLIKPRSDGCSSGVARIAHLSDFEAYFSYLRNKVRQIPACTLSHQKFPIEMPNSLDLSFLLEPFIYTDKIHVKDTTLQYEKISGWCEITLAVFEKLGEYTALNPSITIAKNHTLSLEEKFQGGTGVNLTPPPEEIIGVNILNQVRKKAAVVAEKLGIKNYARLDLFVECATGRIQVIEVNTLPALTPSTVLYHQAISLPSPLFPKDLLAKLIQDAKENFLVFC
jgi:D-alanine--D-alanine ligase